jgi:hypothetical protein
VTEQQYLRNWLEKEGQQQMFKLQETTIRLFHHLVHIDIIITLNSSENQSVRPSRHLVHPDSSSLL